MNILGIISLIIGYFLVILLTYYIMVRWVNDYIDNTDDWFDIFISIFWPISLISVIVMFVIYWIAHISNKVIFDRIKKLALKGREYE